MRTVWKYSLGGPGCHDIGMPQGAEVIRFADQNGNLALWAIVSTDSPLRTRYFRVMGTGDEIGFEYNTHRGSCEQGPFIWHLFENTLP